MLQRRIMTPRRFSLMLISYRRLRLILSLKSKKRITKPPTILIRESQSTLFRVITVLESLKSSKFCLCIATQQSVFGHAASLMVKHLSITLAIPSWISVSQTSWIELPTKTLNQRKSLPNTPNKDQLKCLTSRSR